MKVILSKNVEIGMNNYLDSLKNYGISAKRAQEKYNTMNREVLKEAQRAKTKPVCMSQVLGQVLNEEGNPTNENLRRYDYTDNKSKNQWAFSFLIDEEHDEVTVYRMCYYQHVVNEEHDGASIRRVTETEFRQIVKEEVVKFLGKFIK